MRSENQATLVAYRFSGKEARWMTNLWAPTSRKSLPRRLGMSTASGESLCVRHEISQHAIEAMADDHPAYARWLRIVLLRLLVKTPALGAVKGGVSYELSRTCEFLGFTNFENFAEGRSLSDVRAELSVLLENWEAELGEGNHFPRTLETNLQALAAVVGLNRTEMDLLGLAVLIHAENVLDNACSLLGTNLSGYNIERVLAPMLGLAPDVVAHALQRSEKLATSGLLSIDLAGQGALFALLDLLTQAFASRMLLPQTDIRKILEGFVKPVSAGGLSHRDYPHVQPDLIICLGLLKHAAETNAAGTNILIYGKPGTGKTEFARMLVNELQYQLMAISPTNSAGAPVAPIRRVRNFRITQAFFQQSPAVILFDECEEILSPVNPHDPGEDETTVPRKSWINHVLETNLVPTIWIANSVRGFDEAYLRRFSFCMEMPMPSQQQREDMMTVMFNGLIGSELKAKMTHHQESSPALLTQTARVMRAICGDMPASDRDNLAIHLMNSTLKAQEKKEILSPCQGTLSAKGFEPGWINTSVDLGQLRDCLLVSRSGRLCIYGPPGTGKTAFGKWLAKALDMPHMVIKASELLRHYVGETEQHMAQAFEAARQQKALLQFDEVDSFLQDRHKASKQWEITQVNEMLTQMESFQGVFIASTNLFDNLDEASLRRFDLSIKFDFMKPDTAWKMFSQTCEMLGLPCTPLMKDRLQTMMYLTPGDFEQVLRRARLLPLRGAEEMLEALSSAVKLKKAHTARPIGFCNLI